MTTPLNTNALSSLLQNKGFRINSVAAGYMGTSKNNSTYTPGTTITSTCLYDLTRAINLAYGLIEDPLVSPDKISLSTYNSLISIGAGTIPALGNSKPPTYVIPSGDWAGQATTTYAISGNTDQGQSATWIPYDTTNPNSSVTQWGYLRLHALQAQNEFNYNNNSATGPINYRDFVSSFMISSSFAYSVNQKINTFVNSLKFLDGVYSNINDLISGDITGVCLSTKAFGQDCITLGKAIDLSNIAKFGLPSALLQTIKKYNALTPSLSLALLASGLSASTIESIINGMTATNQQEQQIYGAFLIIMGQDLVNILIPLNCKTVGLDSLADLLNVKKIFPNSYQALTVPLYNTNLLTSTNSKTYYLIYEGTNVSTRINSPAVKEQVGTLVIPGVPATTDQTTQQIQELPTGFDSYLVNILPTDVALAAGAFSYSMRQIKNIQFVDFEKFAQVVFNIETMRDLALTNGTTVPVDVTLANQGINILALGSGPNKTYTTSDFFGCMSGLPYDWKRLTKLILDTQTTALSNIYSNLYNIIFNNAEVSLDATVQTYIGYANTEISNIYNTNSLNVQYLNSLYSQFGNQLMIEQRARYIGFTPVPVPRAPYLNPYPLTIISFVDSLPRYGLDTMPHMECQTVEAISDLDLPGGQSIVGSMRESRDTFRLQAIGVPADNNIPETIDENSAKELLCNGVTTYSINGVVNTTTPATLAQSIGNQLIEPDPLGTLLMPGAPLPDQNNNPYFLPNADSSLLKAVPTIQAIQAPVYVNKNGIPLDTGQAKYPGSFAGSTAQNLVPINLNTTYSSGDTLPPLYSVPEAIDQVTHCNCDCWLG